MARKIHSRYQIAGTLITQSPIHVGGLGGNADTDLALAIDGANKYYIPGTSLAGALRAWMAKQDPETTNQLWGYQDKGNGHASFILVEDSVVQGNPLIEIRDGVGIDRDSGTAAENFKFDRAILPKGVKLRLHLTVERGEGVNWDKQQQLLAELLAALQDGEIYLGAGKTRGLGKVKLYDPVIKEQQLNSRTGMLDTLFNGGKVVDWSSLCSAYSQSSKKLKITIHWRPRGPVMVKSEGDGLGVDMLPLTSGVEDGLTFVIPGSSLKGVWRSQAERIVRTVQGQAIPEKFADQVKVDLVKTLFGGPAEGADNQGFLGCLGVEDCYAQIPLTQQQWLGVQQAKDEEQLRRALNNAGLAQTQESFHVAIDRWTGGAAEGFLYTVLEPFGIKWEPISLHLNIERLKNNVEIALLLLVLRDFMLNRLPIGFGANRGLGAIAVEKVTLEGKGELGELAPLSAVTLTKADLSEIDSQLLNHLNNQWQSWLNHDNN